MFGKRLALLVGRRQRPVRDYAPAILRGFALILVLAGDWRLGDYIYRQTGNLFLTILGVVPSAIGFVLWWEFAWHYRGANRAQQAIAGVMSLLSLVFAGVGGYADYMSITTGAPAVIDIEKFFGGVILLYMAHIVAGLLYAFVDDGIRDARLMAQTEAHHLRQRKAAELMERSLDVAQRTLEHIQALERRYGREAVAGILESLGIEADVVPPTPPAIPEHSGTSAPHDAANATMPRTYPAAMPAAHSGTVQAKEPAPTPFGSNGSRPGRMP